MKPRYGGTIYAAIAREQNPLVLGWHNYGGGAQAAGNMFVGLLEYDFDLNPKPNIAQSWTISPDGLTYTFNLVHNATWHDGYPVTSADYKWTLENVVMNKDVGWAAADYRSLVKSVEAPDPYTLVVTLNSPFSPFIKLWHPWYMGGALPKHLYEGTDVLNNPYNSHPIGNGPYMFAEQVQGSHVRMVRNPNYFKAGLPYADEIIYQNVPQNSAIVLGLETGEITWMPNFFPFQEYERVSKNPDITISTKAQEAYAGIITLFFNVGDPKRPYVSDLRVRQAIAYGIDKKLLVERATAGLAQPATGPFSKTSFPWAAAPTDPYPYNVTKANEILDAAGYKRGPDGMRFTLTSPGWEEQQTVTKELLTAMAKEIGINFNFIPMEYEVMLDMVLNKKDFDIHVENLGAIFPDPAGYVTTYHSRYIAHSLAYVNPSSYSNPVADALWDRAVKEQDQTKRGQLYRELGDVIQKDLPTVWLWEDVRLSAWRSDWNGFPLCPQENVCPMEQVWWTKGSEVSAASAAQAVNDAERQLKTLQSQMYDVSNAMAKLEEAKRALEAKDYAGATQLADEALRLAQPPYWLYGIAVVALVAIALLLVYFRRRRRMGK